jgi:hypothetical protein
LPITVRMVWRTQKDAHVCPICKALEGYSWTLGAGAPFPTQLVHPNYGPVYDLRPATSRSLVKEEKGHLCRCTLKHQFEVSSKTTEDECSTAETVGEITQL